MITKEVYSVSNICINETDHKMLSNCTGIKIFEIKKFRKIWFIIQF